MISWVIPNCESRFWLYDTAKTFVSTNFTAHVSYIIFESEKYIDNFALQKLEVIDSFKAPDHVACHKNRDQIIISKVYLEFPTYPTVDGPVFLLSGELCWRSTDFFCMIVGNQVT